MLAINNHASKTKCFGSSTVKFGHVSSSRLFHEWSLCPQFKHIKHIERSKYNHVSGFMPSLYPVKRVPSTTSKPFLHVSLLFLSWIPFHSHSSPRPRAAIAAAGSCRSTALPKLVRHRPIALRRLCWGWFGACDIVWLVCPVRLLLLLWLLLG